MLNLSDADLARLRLECLELAWKRLSDNVTGTTGAEISELAGDFVSWCLRDKPVEAE